MSWLAACDRVAGRAPIPIRWLYLGVRWYLILGGAAIAFGLCHQELTEKRVGIGTGITVALLVAGVRSVMGLLRGQPQTDP